MSERFKAIRILFKSVVGTANVIVILLFGLLGQNFTGQECVLLLSGVGISCVLRFEPLFCCLLAVSLGMAVCVGRTMFVPDLQGACNPLFPFP